MHILIHECTHAQERSSALIINRQWRANMNEQQLQDNPAFDSFNKAVEEAVELNTYKPAHERKTLADHPVVQMGDAAAKSVEAAADAVVEEAQALKQACCDFADDLRKGAKEIADRATHILKKIHTAGKELQVARENYLNDDVIDRAIKRADSMRQYVRHAEDPQYIHPAGEGTSQLAPHAPSGRQQPGASAPDGS